MISMIESSSSSLDSPLPPLPEAIETYEQTKIKVYDLLRNAPNTLPLEFNGVSSRCVALVFDFQKTEQLSLNHLTPEEKACYLCSIILHEVHDTLHSLHDIAEDKVVKGEELSQNEIQFIKDLTQQYNTLLEDILPELEVMVEQQNPSTSFIGSNNNSMMMAGIDSSTQQQRADRIIILDHESKNGMENRQRLNRSNSLACKLKDITKEYMDMKKANLSTLLLSKEQVSQFENRHITMSNESLIYYTTVMLISSVDDNHKFRHLFLSNYRVYLSSTNDMMTIKRRIELYDIQKVSKPAKSEADLIDIILYGTSTMGRELVIYTNECSKLRDEIDKCMDMFKSPFILQEASIENHDNSALGRTRENEQHEKVSIEVTIRKADKLRPSPKKRIDNPIFYMGIGNPEHFGQNREERVKSKSVKTGRSPEWNETFTLDLFPSNELLLDVRLYSKVGATKNDFAYGVVNIPLKEILIPKEDTNEVKPELKGKWEIWCGMSKTDTGTRKEVVGDLFATIKLLQDPKSLPSWLTNQVVQSKTTLPLACLYTKFLMFENCQEVPFIYGSNIDESKTQRFDTTTDIVSIIHQQSNSLTALIDTRTRRKIYTLEKSSFLKKEYTIRDHDGNVFAKCFHKMKTIRKTKIRMYLMNGEYLYSMEGGCFDDKKKDNEVIILNSLGYPVASVLFGNKLSGRGKMIMVTILDPLVDRPLIITFCLDQQIEEIDLERFGGEEDRKTLSLVKSLDLSRNHIHRLSNLQSFTSLNILNISRNKLRKLSGLPLGLTKLDVSHNLLTKLVGIEILSSLQELNASYNHINHTYNVFITLGNLTSLNLSNNHIKQLDGMEHLTKLVDLNVMNNEISSFDSIRGLSNLRSLQYLKIKGNPIAKHSNYVSSLSNLVPSLIHIDTIDLNNGLLDELESVASHSVATTSDEDSEYFDTTGEHGSSLRGKRRFSLQSTSSDLALDPFSTTNSYVKRPETPQGRIQPTITSSINVEKPTRPSSAPKRPTSQASSYIQSKRLMRSFNHGSAGQIDAPKIQKTNNHRELEDVKLVLNQEQQENSRLEKVNESLRGEITSLKNIIKNLQQDCDTFKSSNENILLELESLRTRHDRMQRNYRNVQQLYKEEKQKRITSEEGRNELQKQVSKMRVSLHHHKSRLDLEHKEKTQNYDLLKEQHEQVKQDVLLLLEYISVIEQRSLQQQKLLEDMFNLVNNDDTHSIKESILVLSERHNHTMTESDLSERVKSIFENYQPERFKYKNTSRMKGNPNVRNFNELRHLVHSQANASTYKWETTLRNHQSGSSSSTSNATTTTMTSSNTLPEQAQLFNGGSQNAACNTHKKNIPSNSQLLVTKTKEKSNNTSPIITIPSVSPEKKPPQTSTEPLGSSQILKIIEEQSQNLITQLKSNESLNNNFNSNDYEEKAEILSTLNDLTRVDVSSSHENLYSFSPKKDKNSTNSSYLVMNHTVTTTDTTDGSVGVESTLSSDKQDPVELLSKMSPTELQQLLAELSHQYSTTQIQMDETIPSHLTTTTVNDITMNNNGERHMSSNINNNNIRNEREHEDKKTSPSSPSSSPTHHHSIITSLEDETSALTRDIHFPSPEKKILTISPYKNEREMIVKQRLHERLALERKKMGVGGLDL
ncbi:hypothetical protein FDP41_012288 [Naegleria fowleri]|uniref:C2 domain-containing protein n=1 Tax=Naegleria fowleri TaxID=5763 RepID=A0A6A5C3I5_NAEFO|nr:uncharacterized protein FDP41_012288 [Naegleria fowleri]KAF0981631.1 hypothetical protein FDP41_012288 [Naegleria fowleri]